MSRLPVIPDIYILHSGSGPDEALARTLAANFSGLQATPVLMTADELVTRISGRTQTPVIGRLIGILPGTVVALLSETMLKDADRRKALLCTVAGKSLLDFRHYFICVGMLPLEVQDRFPDLALIYENVMLRTEGDLQIVIEDVKRHFSEHIPGFREAASGSGTMFFGTLIALLLAQFGKIYRLRLLLAAVLAVLLFTHAGPVFTVAPLVMCFYIVGLGLSRIDPLDLWPWLGRGWKWSASLDSLHSPQVFLFGPVIFAGAIFGATAAIIAGHRWPLAIGFAAGVIGQLLINIVCVFGGMHLLREAKVFYPADLVEDGTVCDPDHLQQAMRSCLTLRNFNHIVVVGMLHIVLGVSVISAARLGWRLAFVWLAAFVLGVMSPSITAASWLAATAEANRFRGLTKTHLLRTSAIFRNVGSTRFPYALGIDDGDLATFNQDEREELTRLAFLQRIAAPQSLRSWFTRQDSAFISYLWSDEQKLNTAERLEQTLREVGIPCFRDVHSIQDPFVAWREYVASALTSCTHFFLIVSPGIKFGHVVHREIETAIERWSLEMLPAIICIVNPPDVPELLNDREVPLGVRLLLTFCPQMTISEAGNPQLVRYIVEETRRQGKWNDWLTMLSPSAASHRILRMPGIVRATESKSSAESV